MNPVDTSDAIVKEIVISAAAERVFDALSDPRQRVQWWGAEGRFKATHMESGLRVGGAWQMRGTAMGNRTFILRGEYRAIDRPRLLEFTWIADWHENEPPTVVRFDLIENGGATTVRLTHCGFTSEKSRDAYQGWPWLLRMLQTYAEGSN